MPAAGQSQASPRFSAERNRVFQQTGPNEWGSFPGSSTPVSPALALVGFVGLCLLVGAVDGTLATGAGRVWFGSLLRPPATPPFWLFAPVWAALYIAMGVAAWLVWRRCGAGRPLRLWGWQLGVNAACAPIFFSLHRPGPTLLVVAVLLGLLALTIRAFSTVHRSAAVLLLPYMAWVGFTAYLDAGFWWLNHA